MAKCSSLALNHSLHHGTPCKRHKSRDARWQEQAVPLNRGMTTVSDTVNKSSPKEKTTRQNVNAFLMQSGLTHADFCA